MRTLYRRNLLVSTIVHVSLVVILLAVPALLSRRMRRRPREMITYVDLQIPDVAPHAAALVSPPPKKTVVPKRKKKKIQRSRKKVRRVRKNTRRSELTPEEIRKLLAAGFKPGRESEAPPRPGRLPGWYYALVRQAMYDAWEQPAAGPGLRPGLVTRVELRVARNGRIIARRVTVPSGVAVMDSSVRRAVEGVQSLRPLPASFSGRYADITVDFEWAGP